MDCTSPGDVSSREYNHRELGNKKWNQTGFHVFLSRFFYKFRKLSIAEQREQLVGDGDSSHDTDDATIDSTDTEYNGRGEEGKIHHLIIMKHACSV